MSDVSELGISEPRFPDLQKFFMEKRQSLAKTLKELSDYYYVIGAVDVGDVLKTVSEFNRDLANDFSAENSPVALNHTQADRSDENYEDHFHLNLKLQQFAYFRSTYDVWAMIVHQELELFDKLSFILASIDDADLRNWLLLRCQESLKYAHNFRIERRAAYHARRTGGLNTDFPRIQRILTVDDLECVVNAVENWYGKLLQSVADEIPEFQKIKEATKLYGLSVHNKLKRKDPPKQLRRSINSIDTAAENINLTDIPVEQKVLLVVREAERIFDYYDYLFSNSRDEQVMIETQILSRFALERIQSLKQSPVFRSILERLE